MNFHNNTNVQHHQQNIEHMLNKGGFQTSFSPAAPIPTPDIRNQSNLSRAGASIMGFDQPHMDNRKQSSSFAMNS